MRGARPLRALLLASLLAALPAAATQPYPGSHFQVTRFDYGSGTGDLAVEGRLAVLQIGSAQTDRPTISEARVWLDVPPGVETWSETLVLGPIFEGGSAPLRFDFRVTQPGRLHELVLRSEATHVAYTAAQGAALWFHVIEDADGGVRFYVHCEPPACSEWRVGEGLKLLFAVVLGVAGYAVAARLAGRRGGLREGSASSP